MSNFNRKIFKTYDILLAEPAAWEVVHNECFSVDNMTDEELLEALVGDILAVTIWEKDFDEKVSFTRITLTRFLKDEQKARIYSALDALTETGIAVINDQWEIRIPDDQLKTAMELAEVWYDGYGVECPEDYIRIDHDAEHNIEGIASFVSKKS